MFRVPEFTRKHFSSLALITLILYAVGFVLAIVYIKGHVKFNYELESFFPEKDPSLEYYLQHLERFESDHDILLIGLTNQGGIFDTSFLRRVNTFHQFAANAPGVQRVISPVKAVKYKQENGIPVAIPFFHPGNPSKLIQDSIVLSKTDHPVRNFLDPAGGTLCMILKTHPGMGLDSTKQLCREIETRLSDLSFDEFRLAGRTKAQVYIISSMQKEFFFLAAITLGIVVLFLWITFRNFFGVLLPTLTVLLGLTGTLVFILMFSDGIDIFSIILPTVLFVVGVSDSVHILNNYYQEIGKGTEKTEALFRTMRDISFSTLLTAVTSAIGFITLITITIKPIAWFGINAAFGIMLVYAISFTFLIAALYFIKPFSMPPGSEIVNPGWLSRLFDAVNRRGTRLALIFLLSLIPIGYGVSSIVTNSYFTEELREGDPYKEDFRYFDKHLGGVRPFELSVEVLQHDRNIFDKDVQRQVEKVSRYLQTTYGVGGITDPTLPMKALHQMQQGGGEDQFCLPSDSAWETARGRISEMTDKEEFRALVHQDLRFGRIAGRIADLGAIEVERRNEKLKLFLSQETDTGLVRFRVTGISTVLDSNNESLTRNLMEGLIYELLAIGVLMMILFRSWRMMIISLLPNIFPLVFIGGLLGWLGINLNLSSSIIFNIAFGITVDDTIHLLSGYKLYLSKGQDKMQAIRSAYLHSGKAVTMTSFILFGGFAVLLLSDFNGIYHTGLLVGCTLVVALLSDLLLLPNLVRWLHK